MQYLQFVCFIDFRIWNSLLVERYMGNRSRLFLWQLSNHFCRISEQIFDKSQLNVPYGIQCIMQRSNYCWPRGMATALFGMVFPLTFVLCRRTFPLAEPGLGAPLSSYLEGALYKLIYR